VVAFLPNINTRRRSNYVGEIAQVVFLNKTKFSPVDSDRAANK